MFEDTGDGGKCAVGPALMGELKILLRECGYDVPLITLFDKRFFRAPKDAVGLHENRNDGRVQVALPRIQLSVPPTLLRGSIAKVK